MKVDITDVQRLTVKPGDRLVVRVPVKLDAATANRLLTAVRARLGIPDDVHVMILDAGMSMEVVEAP